MNKDLFEKEMIQTFRALPPEKKREALDFLEFLRSRFSKKPGRQKLKGLWKDMQIDIHDQDITDARHQLWSSFPREVEK